MFFDSVKEIRNIAIKNGTSIFVVPDDLEFEVKNAVILKPEEKTTITIEQVREMMAGLLTRQTTDRFVVIRPADKMGPDAANALLKSLEEPGEKVHFILVTEHPSKLLPTILSRAVMYFLRSDDKVDGDISVDAKIKELAKRLIVAKSADLVDLAEEICKKKDGVRNYAMEVVGVAIEMLYKTYFITSKEVFLKKLPKFLNALDGISQNGHVKLQIVANLC